MNGREFNQLRKEIFERAMSLSDAKSVEYTISNEDRLFNFKLVAQRLGIKAMQALLVYVLKHMDALCNDAKTGKQFSDETFIERCIDIICYMVLAIALYTDLQRKPQPNEDNTKPDGAEHGTTERSGETATEPKKWKEYTQTKT